MASTPYVSALRSLNYRLEQFVSACSEPGITPHRLLSLLSDSQTARALLSNSAFLRASSDELESLTGPSAGVVSESKKPRHTRCTIYGHTYDIPDIWLAGYVSQLQKIDGGQSIQDHYRTAIRQWHTQAEMEAEMIRETREAIEEA